MIRSIARRVSTPLLIALVAGAYFAAGRLGLRLAVVNPSATAVWPPAGIALASLLAFGFRVWPGVLLGAFLVNMTTTGSIATCLGIAAGNTLEALVGAHLVIRYARGRAAFERARDVFRFAMLAGVLSTLVSATIGVASLVLGGLAPWRSAGPVWLTWWLGDLGGDLVFAPPLVLWLAGGRPRTSLRRVLEAAALVGATLLAGLARFAGSLPASYKSYPMGFLYVPVLVWAAYRFGPRGAASAVLILSGVALSAMLGGIGPFAGGAPNDALVNLQLFMGGLAVTSLALATLFSERARAAEELQRAQEELGLRFRQRSADLASAIQSLRTEVAARQRAERLAQATIESIQKPLLVLDAELRVLAASSAYYEQFGADRRDTRGRLLFELDDHGWDIPALRAALESVAAENASVEDLEIERQPSQLGKRTLLVSARQIHVDGTPTECVVLDLRDITDQRDARDTLLKSHEVLEERVRQRTAQLLQTNTELEREVGERRQVERLLEQRTRALTRSNRELAQFASIAAHDLQQPLRTVASFVELLSRRYRGRLDAEADEFIRYAVDGVTHAHALIHDLLAYSHVDTTGVGFGPTDCTAAVARAIDNLRSEIVQTETVVTHGPLPTLKADHAQLTQLFQNLIGNAIKFRSHEPPRVHVHAQREGQEWLFAVRDNGLGIDPKHHERIFVIFQRPHVRDDYPGTGVGLAVCRKIVERHGGRIWAESAPGLGSEFLFTLPASPTDHWAATGPDEVVVSGDAIATTG